MSKACFMNQTREVVKNGINWHLLVSVVEDDVFEPWDQGLVSFLILEEFFEMMLGQSSIVLVEMAPGVVLVGLHLVRRFISYYIDHLNYSTNIGCLTNKTSIHSTKSFQGRYLVRENFENSWEVLFW